MRSLLVNGASAVGLLLLLVAAAGSKPNASAGAGDGGTTTTSASYDEHEENESKLKVSISGQTLPNYEQVLGTCEYVKTNGSCVEYYGRAPKDEADTCAKQGGTYVMSWPKSRPCPTENLIGTCHHPQLVAKAPGKYQNYYSNYPDTIAFLKEVCATDPKAEWIDPPAKPAAPAVTPAAKAATPAAKGVKGTKGKTK